MPVDYFRLSTYYVRSLIAVGAAVVAYSAVRFDTSVIDLQFVLLFSFTALIGSRIGITIPKTRVEITVSDTFVFLTMLLYGGEAAVILAAVEAFCSSFRFARKWSTRFFNAALLAISTWLTVWVLRLSFGRIRDLAAGAVESEFILAVFLMALVQYVSNSGLGAVRDAIRQRQLLWGTWGDHFLWTSMTYFVGASAAAIIIKSTGALGPYAFGISLPIILIIYFTYRIYRKNIDSAERFAREIQEREEYFRSAFDNAAGMGILSSDGRWLQVNGSLCDLLGYGEQELLALNVRDVVHREDVGTVLAQMRELLCGGAGSYQSEKRFLDSRGREVWVLTSASVVRKDALTDSRLIFQLQDITDRKRAEERLQYDAFHDALTGLPNRSLFMEHLRHSVERARRGKGYVFAVLFLDFDRFKVINDSLGHLLGDRLLVEVASRLKECVRTIDTVARLGGDEFTVLLDDMSHPEDTDAVLARIQQAVARPFDLGGHEVYTSASIGVTLSTVGYVSAEDALRDADTAMYKAKQLGRARYVMFDPQMHSTAVELLSMETDLRKAVERGELLLHYQPIYSLSKNRLAGFEALVRWNHPQRGMVPPAEFITLAEENGLILQIGEWVIREACRQLKQWRDSWAAAHGLYITVNLSGRQFTQPDLVEQVVYAAHGAELPLGCLKLEVTESVLMENIDVAITKLEQLRDLGVEISIDDFGTGYSSLSYLHRLPIDTLKVDRSFVMRMSGEDENTEIVRTIITLAKSLEMKVVAEGVETQEQRALLQALRCDAAQGFLFSRPLDARAAEDLLPKEDPPQAAGKSKEPTAPHEVGREFCHI